MSNAIQIHGSCMAIGRQGVLLLGEPGAGKSDLGIRLIDRGAKLVADDRVDLKRVGKKVIASAPPSISGLIEVRGVGIFRLAVAKNVPVMLVVQLVHQEWIERLPCPEPYLCMEVEIPHLRLCGFEPSAAIKIEMAVTALQDGSMTVGALKE